MRCVWCESENPVSALQCTSCSNVFVEEAVGDQTVIQDPAAALREATFIGSVVQELSVAGQALVTGPGIHRTVSNGLFVAAGLYVVGTLLAVVINVFGVGLDEAIASGTSVWRLQLAYGNVGLILCMLYLACSGGIIAGALSLRSERHYRWGMLAAVLTTIPVFLPYALIITPVGIWAWVALSRNRFAFL